MSTPQISSKRTAASLTRHSGTANTQLDEECWSVTTWRFVEAYKRARRMHSLSHRLHSSTLATLGLVPGLQAFCQEFAQQQKVQIDFSQDNIPAAIPGDAALCLFRVVQEALRNIKRRSGVDRAAVRLEHLDGGLRLAVSDRGKGFDWNKPTAERGIGIRSMEEHLRILGGRLKIESKPSEGTTIDAWLPVKIVSQRAS